MHGWIQRGARSVAFTVCSGALLLACTTAETGDPDAADQPRDPDAPDARDEAPQEPRANDKCPDLTRGLTSVRMVSQGSHAAARHDMTIEIATSKLTGDSFNLDDQDPTPRPRKVDRALTEEERTALLETLGGICHPVQGAKVDEHAAPGRSTVFEIHRDTEPAMLKLVFGQGASSLATGDRFVDLSREEFSELAKRVPTR